MAKHDSLHNYEIYTHCWCMCGDCWLPYLTKRLRGNRYRAVGRCICRQCPCYQIIEPMRVARTG